MDSFNVTMEQEFNIKSEVSDVVPMTCDHFDNDSLDSSSTHDESSSSPTGKRQSFDEQDSPLDQKSPGSPLPPRKRAKTDEEKEQRRIERIMRNRQAAHASRERKRKHLESLEAKCDRLESANAELRKVIDHQSDYKLRLEQAEAAFKLAQSSGDLGALSTVFASSHIEAPTALPASLLDRSSAQPVSNYPSGSPAPSLEDDCASPDALVIKSEEPDDVWSPLSPERANATDVDLDIYGMVNFSLDPLSEATTGTLNFSDSSSKSRHPAVVTPLSIDF